jgi:hypothetical protein
MDEIRVHSSRDGFVMTDPEGRYLGTVTTVDQLYRFAQAVGARVRFTALAQRRAVSLRFRSLRPVANAH